MKNPKHQSRNVLKQRQPKAFTLVSIMAVGFFAIAMMTSLFPLILQSANSESGLRNSSDLRNAAEMGIDYGITMLNQGIIKKQVTPLNLAASEYVKDYRPIDLTFTDLQGVNVSLRIKKLQPAEWATVKNFSSIYSPLLDPLAPFSAVKEDNWRILEATATKGSLTRSIRVVLEPRYDLPPSIKTMPLNNPTSYFANSLMASSTLTTATPDGGPPLVITSVNELDAVELKTTTYIPQFNNTQIPKGGVNTDPPIVTAPVPSDLTSSPLSLSELASNGQSLGSGSYKTSTFDTSTLAQPVSVDAAALGQPVKVFIQDGNLSDPAITISSSMLPQTSANAGDFQVFYEGTRDFNINLDGGSFFATIYAPNAQIKLTGEGTMQGALVGSQIKLSSSGNLKLDTDLHKPDTAQSFGLAYDTTTPTGPPVLRGYRSVSWQETTKRLAPLLN